MFVCLSGTNESTSSVSSLSSIAPPAPISTSNEPNKTQLTNNMFIETTLSNEFFYYEQEKLGLFIKRTCPFCFEHSQNFVSHLQEFHNLTEEKAQNIINDVEFNWNCLRCPNKYQYGEDLWKHLQSKHRHPSKEAIKVIRQIYNEKKASKFCLNV